MIQHQRKSAPFQVGYCPIPDITSGHSLHPHHIPTCHSAYVTACLSAEAEDNWAFRKIFNSTQWLRICLFAGGIADCVGWKPTILTVPLTFWFKRTSTLSLVKNNDIYQQFMYFIHITILSSQPAWDSQELSSTHASLFCPTNQTRASLFHITMGKKLSTVR